MAAEPRLTIVTNLANGAITQYSNYDFNSYAWCQPLRKLYAANSDGLYVLDDADTDNGVDIDCYLQTMKMALGGAGGSDVYDANFLRGYLNCRATKDISITTTADGWATTDTLTIANRSPNGDWHTEVVDADRGAWGNQWGWRVANVDGGDLSVRSLSLVTSNRKTVTAFSGLTGINNRVDPALTAYNPRIGIRDLAECANMYIDDSFHVHRRRGYTQLLSGDFHSVYCAPNSGDVYVCRNLAGKSSLFGVTPAGAIVGIRSNMTAGARVWYTPYINRVYYGNGVENGWLEGGVSWGWPLLPPHESEVIVQREYYAAPMGRLLCVFNGRIYMAQGDTLWYSERGSPQRWRLGVANMKFEGDITMVEEVTDGMYVSDALRTYSLTHAGSAGMLRSTIVCNYPAIRGTATTTDGSRILAGDVMHGKVAVWASTEGICVGGPQSTFRNLTERRLIYPTAIEGAGVVVAKHGQTPGMPVLYITSLAG